MPTKLIIIRHGETNWSVKKRYCGFSDIVLNKNGVRQAMRLKKRLEKEKVCAVYSSDLRRASGFAKRIFAGIKIKKTAALREMNFGVFEGMTYGGIMKKYPEIYVKWLSEPGCVNIPEGEPLNKFQKRIRNIITEIISGNKNRVIAIITHAGPIKVIISDILKIKNIWRIEQGLASLNIMEIEKRARKSTS